MQIEIKLLDGRTQKINLPKGASLSSDQLRIIMQRAAKKQPVDVMLD